PCRRPRGQCELLAERGGIAVPHIAEAREHTRERLAGLHSTFRGEDLAEGLSECVCVCPGSWAREELTPGSDDDWASWLPRRASLPSPNNTSSSNKGNHV
ncbi:MAG TPA: hypothetical protein VK680_06185, partial [Solirubrobacteraceae bacterium]|nr:hypothetical protein [Solirubrobacteraceae bacterium]